MTTPLALAPVASGPPTVGSLFSGIGGIDLAFERAGFKVAFQVEIDGFCQQVLQRHWPDVPRFGDIRTVTGRDLSAVDVLAGGFPCQPVSVAGRRKAQADERWLWPEFVRLIGDLRPHFVFLENVPGVLTAGGADVVTDLAALGYDAQWGIVAASQVGAPHRRERWFCVAYCNGTRQLQPQRGLCGIGGRAEYSSEILGNTTSERTSAVQQSGQSRSPQQTGSDVMAYADGDGARERYDGNAIGPIAGTLSAGRDRQDTQDASADADDGGISLADAKGARLETLINEPPFARFASRCELPDANSKPPDGSAIAWSERGFGSAQSILGRAVDGLSRQLAAPDGPPAPAKRSTDGKRRALLRACATARPGSKRSAMPSCRRLSNHLQKRYGKYWRQKAVT